MLQYSVYNEHCSLHKTYCFPFSLRAGNTLASQIAFMSYDLYVGTQQSSTIFPLPFDVSSFGFLEPASVANAETFDAAPPPFAAILNSVKGT